ncbi:signal peptide peptidase-like 1 isoform X1 [Gossypium australe]|uniref:Signal peptide peptidase-like 1 isoform X1 n=1 Tax=Gossypium australe TaxID=47621 RepID=A0A5B6W430_9ROSI|nr:signal peptide peptidase-like 1 isoform X1 [Gossypium australe]
MQSLWKLLYLLEPAPMTLIVTAVAVTFGSAFRALNHGKEMERNRDLLEASITLDRSQALMIPVMSSCSLLLMLYLFSSVSQLSTAFTAIASVSSLFFFSPLMLLTSNHNSVWLTHFCLDAVRSHLQEYEVATWLVSGHWILNNFLGISLCVAFVSHVRLPNIKICVMLLVCLFVYDIFWVFFSERFFGANVMVSVATKQASNPVHTVVNSLSLPGLQFITKKLEFPVKIAIPAMLLALVLCFDRRNGRDTVNLLDLHSLKGNNYIWYALPGYAIGLVTALAAGILTHSPQPALLYLVPSTLRPIFFISWLRKDLAELWEGTMPNLNDKSRQIEL